MTPRKPLISQDQAKLKRGQAGGFAAGAANRERIRAKYYANPRYCETCSKLIELKASYSETLVLRFCSVSCAAKKNNLGKRRHPPKEPKDCPNCRIPYIPKDKKQKYCSVSCSNSAVNLRMTKEERVRRGKAGADKSRAARYRQIKWEQEIAEEMRQEGWEIFSPTVVCDRVGVKDGKVFFLEFKPEDDQTLRPGQRRISDLVPNMYQIVAKQYVSGV